MRVLTWNVNGLRAALRKGILDQLDRLEPDIVLFQEVRARPDQLPASVAAPEDWFVHWHPAERPGYSGTAIWSRRPIRIESFGLGSGAADTEGRVIVARVENLRLASIYLPSGSSGEHRQAEKNRWLDRFTPWAARFARSRIPTLLGGDFNIAHTARDLYYAKANEKSSGFLPHERAWFGRLLDTGYCDFVRQQAGPVEGPYSWWSNRGQARKLDRGWRIDYLLGNRAAERLADRAWIDRPAGLAVSDHAPVLMDLNE